MVQGWRRARALGQRCCLRTGEGPDFCRNELCYSGELSMPWALVSPIRKMGAGPASFSRCCESGMDGARKAQPGVQSTPTRTRLRRAHGLFGRTREGCARRSLSQKNGGSCRLRAGKPGEILEPSISSWGKTSAGVEPDAVSVSELRWGSRVSRISSPGLPPFHSQAFTAS